MSPTQVSQRAFLCNALHTPARGQAEFLPNVLIEVDEAGVIAGVHRQDSPQTAIVAASHRAAGTLLTLKKG